MIFFLECKCSVEPYYIIQRIFYADYITQYIIMKLMKKKNDMKINLLNFLEVLIYLSLRLGPGRFL